jgi:hypothetical protein
LEFGEIFLGDWGDEGEGNNFFRERNLRGSNDLGGETIFLRKGNLRGEAI